MNGKNAKELSECSFSLLGYWLMLKLLTSTVSSLAALVSSLMRAFH